MSCTIIEGNAEKLEPLASLQGQWMETCITNKI